MCIRDRFDKWEDDIKKYCEINNLSFEKAKNMAKCWGKDDLILQYYDSSDVYKRQGREVFGLRRS